MDNLLDKWKDQMPNHYFQFVFEKCCGYQQVVLVSKNATLHDFYRQALFELCGIKIEDRAERCLKQKRLTNQTSSYLLNSCNFPLFFCLNKQSFHDIYPKNSCIHCSCNNQHSLQSIQLNLTNIHENIFPCSYEEKEKEKEKENENEKIENEENIKEEMKIIEPIDIFQDSFFLYGSSIYVSDWIQLANLEAIYSPSEYLYAVYKIGYRL